MYKLLLGRAPDIKISKIIADKRLHENSPSQNVYNLPEFFEGYILSNEMIYIIVQLLHQNPQHRYKALDDVRRDLLTLKENIRSTPAILRQLLGHPVLPEANDVGQGMQVDSTVSFQNLEISNFSLKYLAKFIVNHTVDHLSINGGLMPLNAIRLDQLVLFDLSN